MLQVRSQINVADNTGAKIANMIAVVGYSKKRYARVGDIISVSIRKVTPGSEIKKGDVLKGVIVRTKNAMRRDDGTYVRFDTNALVIVDLEGNPRGTRVFGPVPRELRQKFMKIISLAPEVV